MSVAVVADAHLGGPGGTADLLIEQLRELAAGECRHLVLLGDLFHVWVGAEGYETPDIRAIAAVLQELRAKGFRIDYIEGNRDFFIGSGPYAELFDMVGTEVDFEIGGRRYLAVHGDGLNDRDYAYRFWSWLSKSPVSRFFMLNLPDSVARSLVGVTERQLAKTNFKHKSLIPESVIRDYAQSRFEEGFDVLLLGHFHEARRWQVGEGEVQLLEAWFSGRKIERFDDAAK
jgi:UDP-2,3-diacylglucosamine pyrophosphatase LpxH